MFCIWNMYVQENMNILYVEHICLENMFSKFFLPWEHMCSEIIVFWECI